LKRYSYWPHIYQPHLLWPGEPPPACQCGDDDEGNEEATEMVVNIAYSRQGVYQHGNLSMREFTGIVPLIAVYVTCGGSLVLASCDRSADVLSARVNR